MDTSKPCTPLLLKNKVSYSSSNSVQNSDSEDSPSKPNKSSEGQFSLNASSEKLYKSSSFRSEEMESSEETSDSDSKKRTAEEARELDKKTIDLMEKHRRKRFLAKLELQDLEQTSKSSKAGPSNIRATIKPTVIAGLSSDINSSSATTTSTTNTRQKKITYYRSYTIEEEESESANDGNQPYFFAVGEEQETTQAFLIEQTKLQQPSPPQKSETLKTHDGESNEKTENENSSPQTNLDSVHQPDDRDIKLEEKQEMRVDDSFHPSTKHSYCADLFQTVADSVLYVTTNQATSSVGIYACNLVNVISRQMVSVGVTTFIRELMIQYLKPYVGERGCEYLAVISLAYSVGLNVLGLVSDRCVGKEMDQVVNKFCNAMEHKIREYIKTEEIDLNEEQLKELFETVRQKNLANIENQETMASDTYKNFFNEGIDEVLQNIDPQTLQNINQLLNDSNGDLSKLRRNLEHQLKGKYWDTLSTAMVRVLNIISLFGFGYGGWRMDVLKSIGLDMAVLNFYCWLRDFFQENLRLEENIPRFYVAPTILSCIAYGSEQAALTLAMNKVAESTTNPVIISLGKALLNTAWEIWDYFRLCGLHTWHSGGDPLKVSFKAEVPSKAHLLKAYTGVGTERPTLFDHAVIVPEVAKSVALKYGETLSPVALAFIGGYTLGIGYFFLILLLMRAGFACSSAAHGFFGGR